MICADGVFSKWSGKEDAMFTYVRTLQHDVYRAIDQRFTARFEVNGQGFFVKYHRGLPVAEFLKNIVCLRWPVVGARDEWRAVRHLLKYGIPTMTPVAFGERGFRPFWQESFLITEELVDCLCLSDYVQTWSVQPPRLVEKRHLIDLLAKTVSGMHRSGLNHRDCYLCHFLWHRKTDKLHVIDLHRAQIRTKVPTRWLDKDLGALYTSSDEVPGLTRLDLFRFLRTYHGGKINREECRRLLSKLEKRAQKIRAHTEKLRKRRGFL